MYRSYDQSVDNYIVEKSALQIAFEHKNQNIFERLLLSDSINVNQRIINTKKCDEFKIIESKTLIHILSQCSDSSFFSILLNKKNDVNINEIQTIRLLQSGNKYLIQSVTPLYIALNNNNNEIANILLSNERIIINNELKTYVTIFETFEIRLEEKNVFHLVVEKGNINMIEKLISKGKIDINQYMNSSILLASTNYKSYLSLQVPLHIAINNQNIQVIEKLLECEKCNINAICYEYDKFQNLYKKTSLFLAVEKRSIGILKVLLQNKYIDINEKTTYNDQNNKIIEITSPLYKAISNNNLEQVKLLLEMPELSINDKYYVKSIDSNSKYYTKKTITPLYYAVMNQNIDIIKMMIETNNEIDVNDISEIKIKPINSNAKNLYTTKEEVTALQLAIKNKSIDIVSLLINYPSIDVNTKTISIKSIIKSKQVASNSGRMGFSKNCYIDKQEDKQNNTDIFEKEKKEKTALSIAIEKNIENIVAILLTHKKIKYNDKLIYKKSTIDQNGKSKLSLEESMLTIAVNTNNACIIQNLLDMPKIKVNQINNYIIENPQQNIQDQQRTALITAIINNKYKSVECLLKSAKVDQNIVLCTITKTKIQSCWCESYENKVAIHFAIENDFIDILKLIIENKQTDLKKKYIKKEYKNSQMKEHNVESIVYFTVKNCKVESLKTILNNSEIDINDISEKTDYSNKFKETRTPFQFANKLDNYDIIKLLEEKNAKLIYDKKILNN